MLKALANSFKLYNSYSQTKEPFSSVEPGSDLARIYVCGVTPYDTSHIGHALTALTFDILHRYLEYLGYQVKHVQNLTDIDDDIIKRANRDGVNWNDLARQWDEIYRNSLAAINCLPFDNYIPATTKIPEIIEMVKGLIERGAAYEAKDGNIYFRAASFKNYGALSHLNPEELLEKARAAAVDSLVDYPENDAKESVLDFVLWQAARPGEPRWDSPWGEGRPGWHIECSAIGLNQFGAQFEIHGGGADLLFPHHSSEIAQSESYTGQHPFVKYWVHIGMVHLGGDKMSKSLGNLVLVRDVIKNHRPDALRLYLLSIHYREPLHYEESGVVIAEGWLAQLEKALAVESETANEQLHPTEWQQRFFAAMNDDLDTPITIETILDLAQTILAKAHTIGVVKAQAALKEMLSILGLFLVEN
ncbi:MAG: cysteine--tRNA ligase [Chloroflexi bacterium]|uniref:Cysteine--tRNA ligase n=1 Tax=Candidatus Chlorohelix allophototropha TaxID=3003348 RepID=A0A8T7M2D8_9CHLR|nr:cysteine--tRNA ligase [Chloroflexota bacterium]WJW67084.1 cysteine--tRNA ligase [Chloroflexota bacterium L227-S17]